MDETLVQNDASLIGFEYAIRKIDDWLEEPESTGLFVTGQSGSGKTHLIKTYFDTKRYETIYIHPGNFHKRMCSGDYFHQMGSTNRFCVNKSVNTNLPLIIIIDQLEGINSIEKGGMSGIVKYLKECKKIAVKQKQKIRQDAKKQAKKQRKSKLSTNEATIIDTTVDKRGTRVICICQNVYVKKARDLESLCTVLPIKDPTPNDMITWINNNKNITNSSAILKCIPAITPDFRKLSIMSSISSDFHHLFTQSRKYYGLHEVSSRILHDMEPINLIRHYYSLQKILLPLMIHENYRSVIPDGDPVFSSHVYNISRMISNSSILAYYTLNQNEWGLGEYHTLLSCYIPSNYIKHNCTSETKPPYKESIWPAMLNRMSLQCTYKHTYYDNTLEKNTYILDRNTVRFNNERMKRMLEKSTPGFEERMAMYRIRDEKHLIQVQKCM
jgi:hypothetical protein